MNAGVSCAAAVRILDAVAHRGVAQGRIKRASALPTRDRALAEAIVFAALRDAQALRRGDRGVDAENSPSRRDGEPRALLWAGFAQLDALACRRTPRSMPPSMRGARGGARTRPGW